MEGDEREEGELLPGLNAVPGIARVAAGAWFRGATWGVEMGLRTAERFGEAALGTLGLAEMASTDAVDQAVDAVRPTRGDEHPRRREANSARSLRERGGELLDRASDVSDGRDPVHPGFARIIDQLAPDEARILKLLVNEGPQGIVYVNKAAPFGFGAREIARRLSMIGHEAGCLHIELVPAYLDNLVSHGLVAIRRDALEDELPYQVIEAQPEVIEALEAAGGTIFRGQITRRSVHLTDFGRTFCQVCFPPEHLTGEFEAIDVGEDGLAQVASVAPPEAVVD
jgi:hypothetical protein